MLNRYSQAQPQLYSQTIEAYQSIMQQNKRKLKNIQNQYFKNQLSKLSQQKSLKQQQNLYQKQQDNLLVQQKNQLYNHQLQRQRQKREQQKQYLANDYQQTINQKQSKLKYQKEMDKFVERQSLQADTWIRNSQIQRDTNQRKKIYYNQALKQHVIQQQQRKRQSQRIQQQQKQKISHQAGQILKKQYQTLQAKHRQKSLFQQRQNEILGLRVQSPGMSDSRTVMQLQRKLKQNERQLYRQGLQAQYQTQQRNKFNKKRAYSEQKNEINIRYNPITNPIPFVYKNPNVLRMLNQ